MSEHGIPQAVFVWWRHSL